MLKNVIAKLKDEADKTLTENKSNAYGYIGLLKRFVEKENNSDVLLNAIMEKKEKSLLNLTMYAANKLYTEEELKKMEQAQVYSPDEAVWEMLKEYYLTDNLEVDNEILISNNYVTKGTYGENYIEKLNKKKEEKAKEDIKQASIENLSTSTSGQVSLFG